ncbi:hypothetical protein vseg_019039 [Gypsophila vaccaria]
MMILYDQQRVVPHDMRNQLANMVTNTEWSYAIFWTVSTTEEGVIEWGEGYYNGETKKRKTSSKYKDDVGIQRSEQLRKVYESLLQGKLCEQGKKRTSSSSVATLCMDELSHLEWFYMLCMSFSFNFGQSLPGRAYATGQHIWLCDAQTADSDVFTRSLLAKSASVQTVICFPFMGGVVELGSTELISEDMELIERILKTSQEFTKPVCPKISSSIPHSTDYDRNHLADILPSIDFTADHIFDEEIENVVNQSIRQDENITSLDDCSIGSASPSQNSRLCHDVTTQQLNGWTASYGLVPRAFDSRERSMFSETGEEFHYKMRTDQMIENQSRCHTSYLLQPCEPRHLNVLHSTSQHGSNNVPLYASNEERECEQFMILRSMVHSHVKLQTNEPSILSVVSPDNLDTRDLDELNFGMDLDNSAPTNSLDNAIETDISQFIDIEMSSVNDDVQVEMSCTRREYLLLDIMKALHNLNLDVHTVQSSSFGGALFLSLKAKFRGAAFVSEEMIKQALWRVINDCK